MESASERPPRRLRQGMSSPRILFVDDEPNVLSGLRNSLRKDRHRWDLVFAESGEAALEAFTTGAVDIIVCDMRMPGMDGAEVLRRVKADYPETTRIVLSGQADREGMERALPVTHQFLCKPCETVALRAVLERTCALREAIASDAMRRIVGRVSRLPSEPTIYWDLVSAVSRSAGTAEISRIVERDPAMTAKVLQIVNSAYFGIARPLTSVAEAVTYLGIELVKGLTLTAHVFKTLERVAGRDLSTAAVQSHALMTAKLAERFAGTPALREEAFAAAMLCDIGELIFVVECAQQFVDVAQASASDGRPRHVVERERLGVTHAEVGGYLLGLWGLPFPIVEAVTFHHEPARALGSAQELVGIVHVAAELTAVARGERAAGLDLGFLEAAGFTPRLPAWLALARAHGEVAGGPDHPAH